MSKYQIVELAQGVCTVRALDQEETFHPVIGPEAEAEALYIGQLDLRRRFAQAAEPFVVWDIGLGAAANALALLRATANLPGRLTLLSFDRTLEPLRFGLAHAGKLRYPLGYENQLQTLSEQQIARFAQGRQRVEWQVMLGNFADLIGQPAAVEWPKPDAIFFDPYSPAKNPEMWTGSLFAKLYELAAGRPATLATYSRSTMLRASLLLAGFFVGAGGATGEKEETTIAATAPELLARPLDQAWLHRARRSRSAEPLREAIYRQLPLSPESWSALASHPQFSFSKH